jgi:hypothetical protein
MQPDLVIQRTLQDIHDLLLAKSVATRNLSDERTVLCMHVIVGKEDVRQALEKANDTALCFALREVKVRPRTESKSEDHDRSPMAHHQTAWTVRQTKPSGDLLVEEAVDRLTSQFIRFGRRVGLRQRSRRGNHVNAFVVARAVQGALGSQVQ